LIFISNAWNTEETKVDINLVVEKLFPGWNGKLQLLDMESGAGLSSSAAMVLEQHVVTCTVSVKGRDYRALLWRKSAR